MTAELDRFYALLEAGTGIARTRQADLEREAGERAVEAVSQVGFDSTIPIPHPGSAAQRARLAWPSSVGLTELTTWNYMWSDPVRAAVDVTGSSGAKFGLLNSEPHRTILHETRWTHWGAGIHRAFRPGDDASNPLLERWYFILWLATGSPTPTTPTAYEGWGSAVGLAKAVRFPVGTHWGYRFTAEGLVVARKSLTLVLRGSNASAKRRAADIPGRPGVWLLIADGHFAGHWVREGKVETEPNQAALT